MRMRPELLKFTGTRRPVCAKGVTVVITLGTGIGSAIFIDGSLLPNTELGLIEMHGMTAEKYTAASVKTKEALSWQEWATRLQEYLGKVEVVLKPDTLILGGGISADFKEYAPLFNTGAAAAGLLSQPGRCDWGSHVCFAGDGIIRAAGIIRST